MRKWIVGTDWWTDCDDAVAMRLVVRAHLEGKIQLLGVGIDACMPCSAASVDGFLHGEGVSGIPLGIDLAATDFTGKPPYQQVSAPLAKRYLCNEDAEDAVRLYRRLLAAAQEPVEILEIGFPQVLANILSSPADDLSPLNGLELAAQKVKKLWVMAGKWDEDGGREHNFCLTERASRAAHALCEDWPTPITFLGWEVGCDVVTGKTLGEGDLLRDVLIAHGSPNGRFSWDPMLVLLALTGDENEAGYDLVRGQAHVDAQTGANTFQQKADGLHGYVVRRFPPDDYERRIEALIRTQ